MGSEMCIRDSTNANETPALQLFNGTSIDQKITPPTSPWFSQQRPRPGPLSFSDDGIGGAPSIVLNQTLPTLLLLPVSNSTTNKVLSPSTSALPTLMMKKPLLHEDELLHDDDDPLLKSVPAFPTTNTSFPAAFKTTSNNSQKIGGAFNKEQIEEEEEEVGATADDAGPLNSVDVAVSQTLPANYEMNPKGADLKISEDAADELS